ncbi:MAG: acylphosphatase [Planctomycetes bacterium]|nr:acylphosphatase [Planctomycetota bacterium]
MDDIARHVLVSGRVQGVAYRHSTAVAARAHGVRGWVRNLRDGRVEARLEGRPEAVAAMLAWMGRGPPAARVDGTQVGDAEPEGLAAFEVRPTA